MSTSGAASFEVPAQGRFHAPKTAEIIASYLRVQIAKGELEPGATLPSETQLMEQFGVSRPTLREAFRILETEKLISVRRGSRGGARVMSPDPSVASRFFGLLLQISGTTIVDVYEARLVIEPACARMLAQARSASDLADLRERIQRLREVVAAGTKAVPNPSVWSDLTYDFHELMIQRCGNKTLALQAMVLQDIVRTHLETSVASSFDESESPPRFQRVIRAYERFLELVEARDADAAAALWRKHMEVASTYLFRNVVKNKPVVDLFD